LCILGLVCFAAINATESSSSNDHHEKSHIHESSHHKEVSDSFKDANGTKYVKQTGDVTREYTRTDNESSYTTDVFDHAPITKIVDGKIITIFKKTTTKVDNHRKFKEVKRFWKKDEVVDSVTVILKQIGNLGTPLKETDYELFNSIATTDYGKYWSDYNYWEIKDSDLTVALTNLASIYKTPIDAAHILEAVAAIEECKDGSVAAEIPTDAVDINNADGWTIFFQFFAATCSTKSDKNQIFAWAASKQGEYLPGQYSEANARMVSSVIKVWLVSHLPLLVSCTNSPAQPMHVWGEGESSINESYEMTAHPSESSSSSSGARP